MGIRRLYENKADRTVRLADEGRFWDVTSAADQAVQMLSNGVAWRPSETEEDLKDWLLDAVEVGLAHYDAPGEPPSYVHLFPDRAGLDARRLMGFDPPPDNSNDPLDRSARREVLAVANAHNLGVVAALMEEQDIGQITVKVNGRRGYVDLVKVEVLPEWTSESITAIDGLQTVVRGPSDHGWVRAPARPLSFEAAMAQMAQDIADRAKDGWQDGPGGRVTVMFEGDQANLDLGIRKETIVYPDFENSTIDADRAPLDDQPEGLSL